MAKTPLSGAPSGSLGAYEISKILREVGFGALTVTVGALVTYFAETVAPQIDESTSIGLVVAAALRIALEFGRRWLADNTKVITR